MQRKIPTLVGILLTLVLVMGLAFTTSQVGKVTKFFSQAEGNLAPVFVGTGNITDLGFTVYWTTAKETSGAVFFGKTPTLSDGVAVDDRDADSSNGKYLTHFVRVNGLAPKTKYYFKVGSGTATFGDPTKTDGPFVATTGGKLTSAPPVVDPVFGKVLDSSGTPLSGIVAVWEATGAGKIISLSKNDGTYVLPVANARREDLQGFFDFTSTQTETITLEGGTTGKSVVSCQPGLDRPVPTIKLGVNADCSGPDAAMESTKQISSGFKTPQASSASSGGELTTNISEGEKVSSPLPTISGKAGPNQVVKIEIHSSTVYSGTVKADPSGNWSWTPPANLSPGQHTVTITIVNIDGTTQTVTRTFYVGSGETILPITSGTPSATLTHLACLNNSCAAVSGAGPDNCATNSDCSATPSATLLPATPPASPPVVYPPPTGRLENTLVLLILGLVFATLGIGLIRKNE